MANIEHKNITDPNIHEVKGASTATLGQVLTATGLGTATFQTPAVYSNVAIGWYNVSDTLTGGTPIPLTVANTQYDLTNNALGANTTSAYGISGIATVWLTGSSRFDFSGLAFGDIVTIVADVSVTTTNANSAVSMRADLGVGQPANYQIQMLTDLNIKTASTKRIVVERIIPMRDTTTKDFPARLQMSCDTTGATVVVNSFVIKVEKR